MGLSMYKIDFDPAAPTETDRIGAFLIGAGGTVITDTGGSLNVNMTNALVNTEDSIAIGDETNIVDMQQMDAVFGTSSWGFPVFGIRRDASGSPVSADGDAHPFVFNNDGELKVAADLSSDTPDDAVDTGNPVKMGTRTYADTLTAVSAAGDRANLASDVYRRTHVNDSCNVGMLSTEVAVTNTAALLVASSLAGRKKVTIQNTGSTSIFIGGSAVTSSGATKGLEIKKGDSYTESIGAGCAIYVIAAVSGTCTVLEAA